MISSAAKRTPIEGTGRELVVCAVCGTEFEAYRSSQRSLCGRECYAIASRRPRTPENWLRIASILRGMKARCHNQQSPLFEYYGARGIQVCQEWRDSTQAFFDWAIANGYQPTLEIDRRDPNGNYEPGNCRWATRSEQMRNTRKRRDGITSRFRGVSWCANANRWRVQIIKPNGGSPHSGLFNDEIEAAKHYDRLARELYGEFASLNFPQGGVPS